MPPVQPAISGASGESGGQQLSRGANKHPTGRQLRTGVADSAPYGVRDYVSHIANAICLGPST